MLREFSVSGSVNFVVSHAMLKKGETDEIFSDMGSCGLDVCKGVNGTDKGSCEWVCCFECRIKVCDLRLKKVESTMG